jgi:cytochrome c oxidase cbb3-type subunit 4
MNLESINPGTISSVLTVVFFLLFVAIVWWAYHRDNKQKFEDAANLPFEEDADGKDGGH